MLRIVQHVAKSLLNMRKRPPPLGRRPILESPYTGLRAYSAPIAIWRAGTVASWASAALRASLMQARSILGVAR